VTIPVDCPHCETRFQLSPELIGKSMRCPECREVFVVQSAATPVEVPPTVLSTEFVEEPVSDERPFERVETDDFARPEPVREDLAPDPVHNPPTLVPFDDPVNNPPTLAPLPDDPQNPPTLMPLPDDVRSAKSIPTAKSLPTAPLVPGPREVAWSGAAPPPAGPARAPSASLDDDDQPFIRRRRRRTWPKLVLAGVAFALIVSFAATGIGVYRYVRISESNLAQEAEDAYKDGNYPVAQKKYEELLERFGDGSNGDKYRFFAGLSGTQAAVGAVTARENPGPALKAFHQFVGEYGESPLAQPETGYGADVVQAGRRLAETVGDHAGDKLKSFRDDRKKLDDLTAAEQAVGVGRRLLDVLEKFRDKEAGDFASLRGRYDGLEKSFAAERHRLDVLAPFRDLASDPSSTRIEEFQTALKDNKLTDDREALDMLRDAEREFIKRLIYTGKWIPPRAAPEDPLRPVLFAAPVAGSPDPRAAPGVTPDVAFAVARGVLYALDAETGRLLWGARVAPPTADPRAVDLPTRVPIGGGAADVVLVAGEVAGRPGLTARVARTGDPVWHQPLEALPAARPVVVGGRIYLPLKDPFGKVVEFDTNTGARSGEFSLRQPVGAGLAVLPGAEPGLNYLFVPGDTRRVFVFEVGRKDAGGNQLQPRCARVLLTEHPRDSLRGEPVLVTPADEHGPRFLILAQTDGPQSMKLRAFPLPPPEGLAGAGDGPAEEATPRAAEVSVPGWAWFSPQSNGERVVLSTDAGAFLAFGVNQAGNADAPLFTLPTPRPAGEQDAVARSQVVTAEEDAYWAVLGGQLVRLRTAVDPASGLRIVPQGSGRPVGEPVNRPQVLPGMGLGVVVARPAGSANVQAVGFDLQTGQVRWQRRLGVTPGGPPVVAAGGDGPCVVADEDGGVYAVSPVAAGGAGTGAAADVVARPFAELAGRAVVVGSADGKTAWVLAPEADNNGRRLRVRCVTGGRLTADAVVPLADEPAGRPVALGESVLVPLANGYVYRFAPGDRQLEVGPLWRGDAGGEKPECFLTPLAGDEFLATDGGRRFLRWRWPAGAKAEKTGGPWEAKAPIAVPPAAVGPRFASLDAAGVVFLFDADKSGPDPVRRWRGGDKSPIPAGRPTDRPTTLTAGGRTLLIYAVDRRHLVAIDPDKPEPAWVARDLAPAEAGGLTGWVAAGGRVIATDQTGRVVALEAGTGKELTRVPAPPAGTVAVAPAVPLGSGLALLILEDGSAATVPLPPEPDEAPAPTPKE
jgi:outer membrane protein assembly factor BamB